MNEANRAKLLGKYRTPRFRYGDEVTCAIRGDVKIVGLTNACIPWPTGRSGKRSRAIILYGALTDAVRRESAEAIMHWFGVRRDTVWRWRKALGVERTNEGTSALHSRWSPETVQSKKANKKRMASLKSPERAAKIAAALTGRKRPAHVGQAVGRANKGRKLTPETRRKMSVAHKRRGTIPPLAEGITWTKEEDTLLGKFKDKDVAAMIGRSQMAVSDRRYRLGVAAFVKRSPRSEPIKWTPAKDQLLGTMADTDLARKLRCSPMAVFYRRKRLKIARFR